MAETPPTPPRYSSEREIREVLHGIKPEANIFPHAVTSAMQNQPVGQHEFKYHRFDQNAAREALAAHGITLDPLAAPPKTALLSVTPEDWRAAATSPAPAVTLWSRAYVRRTERLYGASEKLTNRPERTPESVQSEQALFASLPLVHQMSFEALQAAFASGNFKSNRQLVEEGVDVTAGIGHTTAEDRNVGLDGYVFADFGRPASNRDPGEVAIVLEPEAMMQPGAFITERDLLDCRTADGGIDYRKYMSSAVLPTDFYAVALKRILTSRSMRAHYAGRGLGVNYSPMELHDFVAGSDSDPDQMGTAHFSTWEVKMPTVATAFIRKIIFTSPEQQQAFHEQFGNQAASALASPKALRGGVRPDDIADTFKKNMELFGTDVRYQRELEALRGADYQRRQALLEQSDEVHDGYMLINHPNPNAPDAVKYDPTWYLAGRKTYASADEALAVARREYDPRRNRYYKTLEPATVIVDEKGFNRRVRAPMPEALVWFPEITVAHVKYTEDGTAVMEGLSIERTTAESS